MSNTMSVLEEKLKKAVSQAMENIAFEEAEIIKRDSLARKYGQQSILWACIQIYQPLEGKLILALSPKDAKDIAQNALGIVDKKISDSAVFDSLAEMLNTIAGRFVNELATSNHDLKLALPTTGKGRLPPLEQEVLPLLFDVGGHSLMIIVMGGDFLKYADNSTKLQECSG